MVVYEEGRSMNWEGMEGCNKEDWTTKRQARVERINDGGDTVRGRRTWQKRRTEERRRDSWLGEKTDEINIPLRRNAPNSFYKWPLSCKIFNAWNAAHMPKRNPCCTKRWPGKTNKASGSKISLSSHVTLSGLARGKARIMWRGGRRQQQQQQQSNNLTGRVERFCRVRGKRTGVSPILTASRGNVKDFIGV